MNNKKREEKQEEEYEKEKSFEYDSIGFIYGCDIGLPDCEFRSGTEADVGMVCRWRMYSGILVSVGIAVER